MWDMWDVHPGPPQNSQDLPNVPQRRALSGRRWALALPAPARAIEASSSASGSSLYCPSGRIHTSTGAQRRLGNQRVHRNGRSTETGRARARQKCFCTSWEAVGLTPPSSSSSSS